MNIDNEIKETIKPCLHSAIKRWFDIQGKEMYSSKQHAEIIKAFDTVQGILSLIDENIHFNYESSNELDQIVNVSKLLTMYIGDIYSSKPDFTGYMINTLTQDQTTRTLIDGCNNDNN